jgi:hypothetical protein
VGCLLNRPMAQQLQSHGRGDDTMLIHMTPKEVGGLQALAMAHGGSLTINPHTGLPEAGFLSKLLPMIIGMGLNFIVPGVGSAIGSALGGIGSAAGTGLLVGAGATAITGDLRKGLMAGLGAFGGASLAGGIQGAIGGAAAPTTAATAAPVAGNVAGNVAAPVVGNAAGAGSTSLGMDSLVRAGGAAARQAAAGAGSAGLNTLGSITQAGGAAARQALTAPLIAPLSIPSSVSAYAPSVAGNVVKKGLPGFFQGFTDTARGSMTGLAGKAAVPLAIMGSTQALSAFTPTPKKPKEPVNEYGYTGPYTAQREEISAPPGSGGPLAIFDPTKAYGSQRYFGGTSYADSSGKPYIPGMKTTPTAANATSSMAQPMGVMLPPPAMNQNINPGQLTPEQLAMLQQYGAPQGYADGGQVGDSTFTFPSQMSEQQPQMMPQPSSQLVQQQPQDQQPSPYMQQSSYGQSQQGNNPNGLGQISNLPGLARGGEVPLKQGSFVVDARTVSELGNGSSGAGQDILARLGGMAIRGPGDGVSDSIRANIGGMQQARVARDEVQFSPGAVQRLGKGSHSRGTKKLYALMNKAQTARKSAKRGQDTGLRRGVA